MRQIAAKIVLLSALLAASAEGGWYAIRGGAKSTTSGRIEGEELVLRIPLVKHDIPVISVTLKEAGDYLGKYVVEVTLARQLDSGDGYILAFNDTVVQEIKTRGNRWAFGFDSIEVARKCIEHLRDHHKLEAIHVLDTTRG